MLAPTHASICAGTDATGAKVLGRISLFNGTTWSLVRRGADNEHVILTAVPPNQVWAHVANRTSGSASENLYTGKQGVRKVRACKGFWSRQRVWAAPGMGSSAVGLASSANRCMPVCADTNSWQQAHQSAAS